MKYSKALLTIVSLTMASSSFAVTFPLLSYSWNSGTTLPNNRQTETCLIYANKVVKVQQFGKLKPETKTTQTAYTIAVKNANAIIELRDRAIHSKNVEHGLGGTLGSSEVYSVIQPGLTGRTFETVIKSTRGDTVNNKSKAAKTLIQFIDFNCLDQ